HVRAAEFNGNALAMPTKSSETMQVLKSFITPRKSESGRECVPYRLDAQFGLVVTRTLYSILLAGGTK
ncbi:MAG: hypothetical protein ACRD3B_20035, partial [Candidatus Sulfotelmatobacter sp.]